MCVCVCVKIYISENTPPLITFCVDLYGRIFIRSILPRNVHYLHKFLWYGIPPFNFQFVTETGVTDKNLPRTDSVTRERAVVL